MPVEPGYKINALAVQDSVADLDEKLVGGLDGDPIHIGAVTDGTLDLNIQTQADDSGGLYDEFRTVLNQEPMYTIVSKDIRDVLALTGAFGVCLKASASDYGAALYFQKADQCVGRVAPTANGHAQYQIHHGLMIPTTLQAVAGQDATIGVDVHGIVHPETFPQPLQWKFDSPLLTKVECDKSFESYQYSLGVCGIALDYDCDGTQDSTIVLDDLESVSIDFGVAVSKRNGLGSIWPVMATIDKAQPTITIVSTHLEHFSNTSGISLVGSRVLNEGPLPAETIIQLRRRSKCTPNDPNVDGFDDNCADVHINFRVTGLINAQQPAQGSGVDDARITLTIQGTRNEKLYPAGNWAPLIPTINSKYNPVPHTVLDCGEP